MPTQIAGFVLRCLSRGATAQFYQRLGLKTDGHQHGGPFHFEVQPVAKEVVIELYTASRQYSMDAITLMVDSIAKALEAVKDLGVVPKTELKTSADKKLSFQYITDPDGRDVMLMQKNGS